MERPREREGTKRTERKPNERRQEQRCPQRRAQGEHRRQTHHDTHSDDHVEIGNGRGRMPVPSKRRRNFGRMRTRRVERDAGVRTERARGPTETLNPLVEDADETNASSTELEPTASERTRWCRTSTGGNATSGTVLWLRRPGCRLPHGWVQSRTECWTSRRRRRRSCGHSCSCGGDQNC